MPKGIEMQNCKVSITTTDGGKEHKILRLGELDVQDGKITLVYQEENALVSLKFEKERVEIVRNGDYTLRLFLEKDGLGKGWLGIAGGEGEIQTNTHKLSYSVNKNGLMALLNYDLIISGEIQEMKLRISAQTGKTYEN